MNQNGMIYTESKKRNFILSTVRLTMLTFFVSLFSLSCEKFVEVAPPVTQLDAIEVYKNNATAISVLTGIYSRLSSYGIATGVQSVSVIAGLSADELTGYSTYYSLLPQAYSNSLNSKNAPFWTDLYSYIYTTNAAIIGLGISNNLNDQVKKQLLGEAKFMRAFFYFYLVNLYGDVPIIITTDYRENAEKSRSPKTEVYKQIVTDLIDAKSLLNEDYVSIDAISSTDERVRPNKWTAMALLARVYLYTEDFKNAEFESTQIIENHALYDTVPLNDVFLNNSKEALWQLQPVNVGWNTEDARVFILTMGPNDEQPTSLSHFVIDAFETDDKRLKEWVGVNIIDDITYYYPYKYKIAVQNSNVTEYLMIFRLAEQYLIRAEARNRQGIILGANGAIADLDVIRNRAGLTNSHAVTGDEVKVAIEHERQVELFSEWGHRWLDLKRTNRINDIMPEVTVEKGGTWNTNWQLYPIPLESAIQRDKNIIQNAGY
jgi:hypothetical protein